MPPNLTANDFIKQNRMILLKNFIPHKKLLRFSKYQEKVIKSLYETHPTLMAPNFFLTSHSQPFDPKPQA